MSGSNLKRAYHIVREEGLEQLGRSTASYLLNTVLSQRTRVRARGWRYRLGGHQGVGDPLRVYDVPVNDLNHCITSSEFSEPIGLFKITGGDWDEHAIPLREFPLYIMCKKHFEEGVSWEETDRYERRVRELRIEGSFGELDVPPEEQTVSKYREYLQYLDDLYENIAENGYKRQSELAPESDFLNRERQCSELGEIGVFLGRNGRLIARSGLHRLCFAKLLDIDTVPVRTVVRHREWQSIRDEIATTPRTELSGRAKRFLDHPELRDLLAATRH